MKKYRTLTTALMLALAVCAAGQERRISLDECIASASEHEMSLRNAALDLKAAEAQRSEARWSYYPSLSFSTIGYRAVDPMLKISSKDVLGNSDYANVLNEKVVNYAYENGLRPYYSAGQYGYHMGVSAMQPIYAGGRIRNGNKLAELGVEAAKLQLRIGERTVRDTVEARYWRIVALQEKQNTLREALSLLDSLEKDVQSARAAGLALESDLLQLRLKKSELQAAGVRLRSGIRLSKMDLFNLVGMDFSCLQLDAMLLCDAPEHLPAPSEYIVAEQEQGRMEESELLEMQVRARELERRMQLGESLPQLALGASYGYSDILGQGHGKFNGLAFATLQIPITDIGKGLAREKRYRYQVEKAKGEQEYLDKQLRLQMVALQLGMESAWEQLCVAEQAAEVAAASVRELKASYDAGLATCSQLMQAELALQQASESLIDSRISYILSVSTYQHRAR